MSNGRPNLPESLNVHLFGELFWNVLAVVDLIDLLPFENIIVQLFDHVDLIHDVGVFTKVRDPCFEYRHSQVFHF